MNRDQELIRILIKKRKGHAMTRRSVRITAALAIMLAQTVPAFATIDNTVTVNANGPGGPIAPVTATENVDVINAAPVIAINKTWTFAPGGDVNNNGFVDAGDTVLFNYAVSNTGNVSLLDVVVSEVTAPPGTFQGTGTVPTVTVPTLVTTDAGPASGDSVDPTTGDGDWDKLGPGDVITFTSTYTVQPGDLIIAGNADNDLDTVGQVVAAPINGTPTQVSATDPEPVPLNVLPSLTVTKVGTPDTNVPAGTTVTYTYTVTNNGTVPLTNVTLTDVSTGSGPDPVPAFASWTTQAGSTVSGNTITLLNPGAVAVFTGTYLVTQNDVDTLQ